MSPVVLEMSTRYVVVPEYGPLSLDTKLKGPSTEEWISFAHNMASG